MLTRRGDLGGGLVQSRPQLLGALCGSFDRLSYREVRGGFQVVLLWILIYCVAKLKGSPSHMGLTSMTDDWIVIR